MSGNGIRGELATGRANSRLLPDVTDLEQSVSEAGRDLAVMASTLAVLPEKRTSANSMSTVTGWLLVAMLLMTRTATALLGCGLAQI